MSCLRIVSLSCALIVGLNCAAFAKTEREFLSDAIKGDNSEVALGQLAMTKGSSELVRSFGQTLVNDHSNHRNETATLATQLGVLPSDETTGEAQQEMAKLQSLTGREFDAEFARFMAKDHEKDVSEFKSEAAYGNGPVQKLASESLPTLEEHLRIARALEMGK